MSASDAPVELTLIDEALLLGAAVGLTSERCGRPLQPWQQRVVDRSMVGFLTSIDGGQR